MFKKDSLKKIWQRGSFYFITLALLGLIGLFALFIGRVIIVRDGSMEPTYHDGDIGIAVIARNPRSVEVGDVVVFPYKGLNLIKRVSEKRDNGVFVLGDNYDNSVDSRVFGVVPYEEIKFRVLAVGPGWIKYAVIIAIAGALVAYFAMSPRRRARRLAEQDADAFDEDDDTV